MKNCFVLLACDCGDVPKQAVRKVKRILDVPFDIYFGSAIQTFLATITPETKLHRYVKAIGKETEPFAYLLWRNCEDRFLVVDLLSLKDDQLPKSLADKL